MKDIDNLLNEVRAQLQSDGIECDLLLNEDQENCISISLFNAFTSDNCNGAIATMVVASLVLG